MVARKMKSAPSPRDSAARLVESLRRETAAAAELTTLPVAHTHAAGIDVGDSSHWVCIDADGGDEAVREFPAHTPGLRELVAWLRQCGVTRVALEASGAYGHVLFLTLIEEGFATVMTGPSFTRQIKGRPKTDRRDCQWIQRLHTHGLRRRTTQLAGRLDHATVTRAKPLKWLPVGCNSWFIDAFTPSPRAGCIRHASGPLGRRYNAADSRPSLSRNSLGSIGTIISHSKG